jgi:transcriptional regulator GlxA family with amidase domain
VTCANRLRVLPDHDLSGAPDIDIILVPGGRGTEGVLAKPAMLEWIAATAAQCRWVNSVCTGAELLVAAGPAKGNRVTTYHAAVAGLRAAGGAAEVIDDARWVRDGNVVSAAGVSAGIDMALWLLGELYQPDFARQIQRDIEYDRQPPYADVG